MSRLPSTRFQVTVNGQPIQKVQPTDAVQTGIQYRSLLPGIVPSAEERQAARFGLYTWTAWMALPMQERVMGIAWHRLHRLIELHQGDAVSREVTKRQRQATRNGTGRTGARRR